MNRFDVFVMVALLWRVSVSHIILADNTEKNHVTDWWHNISERYHRFFDHSARFDITESESSARALLEEMEFNFNAVLETPFPPTVEYAHKAVLDTMDATIHGFHATLNQDDRRAARFMGAARRGLAQFEDMLHELELR